MPLPQIIEAKNRDDKDGGDKPKPKEKEKSTTKSGMSSMTNLGSQENIGVIGFTPKGDLDENAAPEDLDITVKDDDEKAKLEKGASWNPPEAGLRSFDQ